jgi:hypothetical protein
MSEQKISITVPSKSLPLAIVLTLIFGPLGLFYVTIPGAIIMLFVTFAFGIVFLGSGFLYSWPLCMIWAYLAVDSHNSRKIEEEI